MASDRQRIVLAMIAKDDPAKVAHAIRSCAPLIDSYLLAVDPGDPLATATLDTGSINGHAVEVPWVNHGHNRTEAIRIAESRGCDYVLMIDSDDELRFAPSFQRQRLTAPSYHLDIDDAGTLYRRRMLFRAGHGWRYEGAAHEVAVAPDTGPYAVLGGVTYQRNGASDRGPDKYLRDARNLLADLERDPGNTRAQFYLAQSYAAAGDLKSAFLAYQKRAGMGGYAEEVYVALYECGRFLARTGQPWGMAQGFFTDAHAHSPHRAEPLYQMALHWYDAGSPSLAFMFASRALDIPMPIGAMHVDSQIYRRHIPGLVAATAYECAQFASGRRAALLALDAVPGDAEIVSALRKYERRLGIAA